MASTRSFWAALKATAISARHSWRACDRTPGRSRSRSAAARRSATTSWRRSPRACTPPRGSPCRSSWRCWCSRSAASWPRCCPWRSGGIAILGTFAELFVLGSVTSVAIYAINLTTALGLALAIDYALLMVSRFREELGRGQEPAQAVVRSVQTAGRTIVFSGATVVAALAVLLIFPMYFLRSFAYAGIGVVLISVAAAVVVLPALLAVLGRRVNSGRLPWARGREPSTAAPLWGRLAAQVMRRPVLIALPVFAVLLAVALPLVHIQLGTPDDRVLPSTTQSRAAGDVLRSDFAGDSSTALN